MVEMYPWVQRSYSKCRFFKWQFLKLRSDVCLRIPKIPTTCQVRPCLISFNLEEPSLKQFCQISVNCQKFLSKHVSLSKALLLFACNSQRPMKGLKMPSRIEESAAVRQNTKNTDLMSNAYITCFCYNRPNIRFMKLTPRFLNLRKV